MEGQHDGQETTATHYSPPARVALEALEGSTTISSNPTVTCPQKGATIPITAVPSSLIRVSRIRQDGPCFSLFRGLAIGANHRNPSPEGPDMFTPSERPAEGERLAESKGKETNGEPKGYDPGIRLNAPHFSHFVVHRLELTTKSLCNSN